MIRWRFTKARKPDGMARRDVMNHHDMFLALRILVAGAQEVEIPTDTIALFEEMQGMVDQLGGTGNVLVTDDLPNARRTWSLVDPLLRIEKS